jgi:hypothetical protein
LCIGDGSPRCSDTAGVEGEADAAISMVRPLIQPSFAAAAAHDRRYDDPQYVAEHPESVSVEEEPTVRTVGWEG